MAGRPGFRRVFDFFSAKVSSLRDFHVYIIFLCEFLISENGLRLWPSAKLFSLQTIMDVARSTALLARSFRNLAGSLRLSSEIHIGGVALGCIQGRGRLTKGVPLGLCSG